MRISNKKGHGGVVAAVGQALAVLLVGLMLMVSGAQAGNEPSADGNGYQGADYWRDVTQGVSGYSTVKDLEAGVLINRSGEGWRQVRNDKVKPSGAWALSLTLLVLASAFLLLGRSRLREPRTGRTLERWKRLDRWLHWSVAGMFIVLAVTGLSILYGRHFLPDVMGETVFATWMQGGKLVHNYLGPLFLVCLLLMVLKWALRNRFTLVDLKWLVSGGGLFTREHPKAGYSNGGEKLWFWFLALGGLAVSASGLALDFPAYLGLREDLQLANLVHAIGSLALICGAFGHAYMGTVAVEGALEGMVTGQVDESWAKQHHELWYEEVKAKQAGQK